ncbi:MAG: hypothetical protein AAFW67_04615 [Cyanobacteria bacterium J06638_38]
MIREIIWGTTLSLIVGACSQVGISQVAVVNPTMFAQANSTAKITEVKVTGEPDNYTFAVTVSSPDTGCVAKPCR